MKKILISLAIALFIGHSAFAQIDDSSDETLLELYSIALNAYVINAINSIELIEHCVDNAVFTEDISSQLETQQSMLKRVTTETDIRLTAETFESPDDLDYLKGIVNVMETLYLAGNYLGDWAKDTENEHLKSKYRQQIGKTNDTFRALLFN